MNSNVLEQARAACEASLLPVAVCLVAADHDEEILCGNQEFKHIFGEDVVGRSARVLYQDPADRAEFLERLNERARLGEQGFRQEILRLRVPGGSCTFKGFIRLLYDETTGKRLGHLTSLIEYAEEEHSLRLAKGLSVGTFGLDAEGRFTFGNQRLATLFGRTTFQKLQGIHIKKLAAEPESVESLLREVEEQGCVDGKRLKFLGRRDTFIASVTAVRTPEDLGRPYLGCEGTVMDVTREDRYRRLIDEIKIGLYELRREAEEDGSPREILAHCNPAFARLNGYERVEEILDRPIADFHKSRESYLEALETIEQRDVAGDETPVELEIRKRRGDGEESRWVAVNASLLRDRNGRVTGRVGLSRDVTDERELREWNKLLTQDIGNLLHSYSQSMMSLRHALDLCLEVCGVNPFAESVRPGALEQALKRFEAPRRDLSDALSELLNKRGETHAEGAWAAEDWEMLERSRRLLEIQGRDLPEELRYATLRQIASEVLAVLSRIEPSRLPREIERRARTAAEELRRLGTLLAILLSRGKIIELDGELRTVRDSVTRHDWTSDPAEEPAPTEEPAEDLLVEELLRAAMAEHAEYAQSREVQLRRKFEPAASGAKVRGHRRDLNRAIGNILHNAVKYSWHREAGTYATVRLSTANGKVVLQVINYGVPIPEDELELVFRIGFRGRFSGDRRRVGTGIGLWDAQRVVRLHGGTLTITSVPASGGDPKNYEQPFLTTVRIELPLCEGKGG